MFPANAKCSRERDETTENKELSSLFPSISSLYQTYSKNTDVHEIVDANEAATATTIVQALHILAGSLHEEKSYRESAPIIK